MKVYWVSRHAPLPAQEAELRRLFGPETTIEVDPRPFADAAEIIQRCRAAEGDEMVVVAPLSVVQQLVERGVKPLWAEMEAIPCPIRDPAAETEASGRCYRFRRFRRVERIVVEFSELP